MYYFNKLALIYDKEEQDAKEKSEEYSRKSNSYRDTAKTEMLLGLGLAGFGLRQRAIGNSINSLRKKLEAAPHLPGTATQEELNEAYASLLSQNNKLIGLDYSGRSLPSKILSYFGLGQADDISNAPGLSKALTLEQAKKAVTKLHKPASILSQEAAVNDLKQEASKYISRGDISRDLALVTGIMGLAMGGYSAYNKYKQNQQEKEIQNVRNKERQYSIDNPIRYNLKRLGF
jgi:hypothetical protein